MAGEWHEIRLGDILTFQRGFDLPIQNRIEGKVPIISSSGICGYHNESKVTGIGIVTGRYGTLGQIFYIEGDYWPLNTTLWVKDFKANHPKFIYYALKTIDFLSCSDKSSVPGLNRNDLHLIKTKLPPLAEQKAIADVLSALDDKIELNRRLNETLEGMARTLFKDWFIDFGPVKAKAAGQQPPGLAPDIAALFPDALDEEGIPVGWEIKPLQYFADFINGYAFKSSELEAFPSEGAYPIIKMGNLQKGGGLNSNMIKSYFSAKLTPTVEKALARKNDILMCMTDMKSSMNLLGHTGLVIESNKFLVNQRVGIIRSKNIKSLSAYHLYILSNTCEFIELIRTKANSGVQVNLSSSEIKKMPVLSACKKLNEAFSNISEGIFDKINDNTFQIQTLSKIRDTLLPKLITGGVRIQDIEGEIA